MNERTKKTIEEFIEKNHVALFMKGSKERPACGFSRQVVDVLNKLIPDFNAFDILSDSDVREGIKEYSSWPTLPQLYVNKEFLGGCDIALEMFRSGELAQLLQVKKAVITPTIHLSDKAIEAFKKIAEQEKTDLSVRILISARFEHEMAFDEAKDDDLIVKEHEIKLVFDAYSAARAEGLSIDYFADEIDEAFSFINPNEPPLVQEITAPELKDMLDTAPLLNIIDVRSGEERALAKLSFARPLYEISQKDIDTLDSKSPIIFHCHHGVRSRREAERWRFFKNKFQKIYSLKGGIDAWSKEIDGSVPLY